jgi:plasmid maintenance system antidote protein VapI
MATKTSPAADHAVPLHQFLKRRFEEFPDLNNVKLAELLGYERPNVVAMILNGTMKLPIAKVPKLAKALDLEPVALLKRVLLAYDPSIWETLEEILGNKLVTKHERKLVEFSRRCLGGEDLDLVADPKTVARLTEVMSQALDQHLRREMPTRRSASTERESEASRKSKEMLDLLERQAAERQALRKR